MQCEIDVDAFHFKSEYVTEPSTEDARKKSHQIGTENANELRSESQKSLTQIGTPKSLPQIGTPNSLPQIGTPNSLPSTNTSTIQMRGNSTFEAEQIIRRTHDFQ